MTSASCTEQAKSKVPAINQRTSLKRGPAAKLSERCFAPTPGSGPLEVPLSIASPILRTQDEQAERQSGEAAEGSPEREETEMHRTNTMREATRGKAARTEGGETRQETRQERYAYQHKHNQEGDGRDGKRESGEGSDGRDKGFGTPRPFLVELTSPCSATLPTPIPHAAPQASDARWSVIRSTPACKDPAPTYRPLFFDGRHRCVRTRHSSCSLRFSKSARLLALLSTLEPSVDEQLQPPPTCNASAQACCKAGDHCMNILDPGAAARSPLQGPRRRADAGGSARRRAGPTATPAYLPALDAERRGIPLARATRAEVRRARRSPA